MNFKGSVFASALAVAGVMGLAACGGSSTSDQDAGQGSASRSLSARAIDGYLVRAQVWADLNGNGALEVFEPAAFTDNDGYFSYNPLTDTDYCAATATAAQARYCLQVRGVGASTPVLIRVSGGYDSATGLPFEGTLSLLTSDLDSSRPMVVTPYTSLLAAFDSSNGSRSLSQTAQEKYQALVNAGIFSSPEDGGLDPLAGDTGRMTRAQILAIIARLTGKLAEQEAPYHGFSDLDSSHWAAGYIGAAMEAALLAGTGTGFFDPGYSQDPVFMADLLRNSVRLALYGDDPMGDGFTPGNPTRSDDAAAKLAELSRLARELEQATAGGLSATERSTILRVLAALAERTARDPSDPQIDNLVAWVRNQLPAGGGFDTDLSGLGDSDIDLSLLVNGDIDPNSNSISFNATIPSSVRDIFAGQVNSAFAFKVDEAERKGAALVFITGEAGASDGELKVCLRFHEPDGDFNTGSDTDPDGAMLIEGNWSLLNGHTLIMSLDLLGRGTYSAMVKAVKENGTERSYRFDYGGDVREWTGTAPAGFSAGDVPVSDDDCTSKLKERFGSVI